MTQSSVTVWILLTIFQAAIADRFTCPGGVEYVSQSLSSAQSKDFLFYGVQQGIESAAQCAKFCYETEFCRSAAYNSKLQTCDLAYANVMRCQDSGPADRVRASQSLDEITAIYCIKCPEDSKSTTTKSINSLDSKDAGATQSLGTNPNHLGPIGATCFVEYEQKVLLQSSYSFEKNLKLDECKCKCANTWALPSTLAPKCRSFQYFPDRDECVLNTQARPATSNNQLENISSFVDIHSQRTSYYDFTCQEPAAVAELTAGYCSKFLPIKGLSIISPSLSAPSINISRSPVDSKDCYDQIEGQVLTGVAGGLEHNVSFEQCKCLCATSRSSGKYDFICKSIMYYRSERDCVLNLENRLSRPDLFRPASEIKKGGNRDYAIIYAGLTCNGDTIKKFIDIQCSQAKDTQMNVIRGNSTAISLIGATIKVDSDDKSPKDIAPGPPPAPGDKTDACFVEINEYILSDMASAIEAGVTIDECKCLCADSVSRYSVVCLSIQYYADTKTCLMNRKNRIQEPNNFKKVTSSVPHTYLDYLCSDVGDKKERYWKNKCAALKLPKALDSGTTNRVPVSISSRSTAPPSTLSSSSSLPTQPLSALLTSSSRPITNRIPEISKSFHIDSSTPPAPSTLYPGASPPVATGFGPCRYSTFYDTEFNGKRLIERIVVGDPLACFQTCAEKKCKSANILNFLGRYKYCEMYSDSSVDYPNTNMITYNIASVYFDGIQCERHLDA